MSTYYKINADYRSKRALQRININDENFLNECYKQLNCESIEIVPTILTSIILIVDECGKLKENWIYNKPATLLIDNSFDIIAGDAIIAAQDGVDIIHPNKYDMDIIRSMLHIF